MIDLHCHMLPGIDDGAPDLETAIEMARMAVADGIQVTACTPHIYPGLYENDAAGIAAAISQFEQALGRANVALRLVRGADVHLTPDLLADLRKGRIPTLNGSRYFLLEPPHHVAPPRFDEQVFNLLANGYVPVITHPERLTWIEQHYDMFLRLARAGAWLQVTAGALTGRFGRRPQYWSKRLLDEGPVHIIATDAHSPGRRPPLLAEARLVAEAQVGAAESWAMVRDRPLAMLKNVSPEKISPVIPALNTRRKGWISRWLTRRG